MPQLQPPLVGQTPLLDEPQGGKDKRPRPLAHDQVQDDGDRHEGAADEQREIDESHGSEVRGQESGDKRATSETGSCNHIGPVNRCDRSAVDSGMEIGRWPAFCRQRAGDLSE
jgi:hypothetical protein